MQIYNLTQHELTEEQKKDGIIELPEALRGRVRELLTFESLPTGAEVAERAQQLAELAAGEGAEGVMLGGVPFLMEPLQKALRQHGIRTFFAFSQRRSTEVRTPEGIVEKRCQFCYEGLVETGP